MRWSDGLPRPFTTDADSIVAGRGVRLSIDSRGKFSW